MITPIIPYPLSEGGKISQYAMIDYLRNKQTITLVLPINSEEDKEYVQILKSEWKNVLIETIISNEVFKKNNIAKSILTRIFYFIKKLSNKGSLPVVTDFDASNGINSPSVKSRDFIYQLDQIVKHKQFDVIQTDFLAFADLVHFFPNSVKKVFIHHEIRFARLASGMTGQSNYEQYVFSFAKNREVNLLKYFDAIIVFSEVDKKKLEGEYNLSGKVYSSPFPVLKRDFLEHPLKKDLAINKLIFIGSDQHRPNREAIEWYVNYVQPILNQTIYLPLYVIGKWTKQNQETISGQAGNGIHFVGFVNDLEEYYRNSIMIVPVFKGSGIRTKILYAMAQAIPVVSTSIGCEGIVATDRESIMIADTPEEFKNRILELYNDPSIITKIIINAQVNTRDTYSQEAAGELRNETLMKIVQIN